MKYILMMNCPKTGYDSFGAWPKKDIQSHIAFMLLGPVRNGAISAGVGRSHWRQKWGAHWRGRGKDSIADSTSLREI